jgi:2-polyprenyl-6-methoxyphenol hydroxylase-like FAD-dependent oxidoreductase
MPSALTATAKTFQAVAKEAPVAGVKTFGLEMSMRDAALTKGAQLAAGAKATLSDPRGTGERHAELTLEGGAKLDLGFPTLIVVADGANSKTREALGVPFEAKTRELSYMVGLVENRDAECSETLNHTDIDDDDTPLQDIVQTSKEHGQSWVCVQIPARHGDDEQASRRHFENRAKEMLGLPAYVDIKLLTEPQRVGVQHRQASEAVVGQNVVIVGDAFAAGTLATGLGVNAAFRHAEHVGQLAEGLFDGGDRATVMGTFEANMRKTASEMFAPSEPLFAGGDDDG